MSSRTAAGPQQVEPAAIESELEKLRIALPHSGEAESSADMTMRTVLANLVAVGSSEQETGAAMAAIGNIIGRNPCRVILVTSEPDRDPPRLAAEVAIICQDSETCRRCVCCDRIGLAGRGIMADNLPNLAAALLIPDLPVIVWWPHPPFARRDFMLFAKSANRVIVDSVGWTAEDLRALAGFVERSRRMGVAVGDLNWGRLTPYRQLFAQFFDSAECRDNLAAILEVRVEGHAVAGRLLAGWLKAQMDKSGHSLPNERIRLVPSDPSGFPFHSLEMTCSGAGHTFAVKRSDECTLEVRAVLGARVLSRVVKSGCMGANQLLADEMTMAGRDAVFENALSAGILL